MFGKKFDKNLIAGLLTSLAIHAGVGVKAEKDFAQAAQENLVSDREAVKDVIFLPVTKEELVQNLLEQAGVKNIEEIQKNPELVHKINLGIFLIQVEFLEKKIDAKQAMEAYLNLELQIKVFHDLYKETKSPLQLINQVENNIVQPEIFLDNDKKVEQKSEGTDDYKSAKALLHSYLLDGKSNCYSSVRAAGAILTRILKDHKIGVNGMDGHVRLIISDGKNHYLVESGSPIKKLTPDDLAETIWYDDIHLAFLSGILNLPNPQKYFPNQNSAANTLNKTPETTESKPISIPKYENTSLGNYFEVSPDQNGEPVKLKRYSKGVVPETANRLRQELPKKLLDEESKLHPEISSGDQMDEKQVDTKIARSSRLKKLEIINKQVTRNERRKKTLGENTNEDQIQDEIEKLAPLSSVPNLKNEKGKARFVLIEAEPMIDALAKEAIEEPDKLLDNTSEILHWLKKLDENGTLDEFIKRHDAELKKLESLRPKPGEKPNAYLGAKFAVESYIKKYQELKAELDSYTQTKQQKEEILFSKLDEDILQFKMAVTKYDKLRNPVLPDSIQISSQDLPGCLKMADEKINKNENGHTWGLNKIIIPESSDATYSSQILEFAVKHPPHEIRLEGNFQNLELLQKFLDSKKGSKTIVQWENPPIGASLKPIWKAIQEDRIQLIAMIGPNSPNSGMRDPSTEFPMIDHDTQTIINANTPETQKKLGKEFLFEYFVRSAIVDEYYQISLIGLMDFKSRKELEQIFKEFSPEDLVRIQKKVNRILPSNKGSESEGKGDSFEFDGIDLDIKKMVDAFLIKKDASLTVKNARVSNFPLQDQHLESIKFYDCYFDDTLPVDFIRNNENIDLGTIINPESLNELGQLNPDQLIIEKKTIDDKHFIIFFYAKDVSGTTLYKFNTPLIPYTSKQSEVLNKTEAAEKYVEKLNPQNYTYIN